MRRVDLKKDAKVVAAEVEAKPYAYWYSAELPINFERSFDGRMVQVEIDMLERGDEYVQLGISTSGDYRTSLHPVGVTVVIENPEAVQSRQNHVRIPPRGPHDMRPNVPGLLSLLAGALAGLSLLYDPFLRFGLLAAIGGVLSGIVGVVYHFASPRHGAAAACAGLMLSLLFGVIIIGLVMAASLVM